MCSEESGRPARPREAGRMPALLSASRRYVSRGKAEAQANRGVLRIRRAVAMTNGQRRLDERVVLHGNVFPTRGREDRDQRRLAVFEDDVAAADERESRVVDRIQRARVLHDGEYEREQSA